MQTKVNLGVGPLPIHPQHLAIMDNLDEWILVDKYVKDPAISNWDAEVLTELSDGSMELIYSSHLLEHIPHPKVDATLKLWFTKLRKNGKLILNVPDLKWTAKQIIKYANNSHLDSGVYTDFLGNNNLQDVVYGTHAHEGERHQSGYTKRSLEQQLQAAGYSDFSVEETYDAHDMMVLIGVGYKKQHEKKTS